MRQILFTIFVVPFILVVCGLLYLLGVTAIAVVWLFTHLWAVVCWTYDQVGPAGLVIGLLSLVCLMILISFTSPEGTGPR